MPVRMPLKQITIHSSGRGSKTWDKRFIGQQFYLGFSGKIRIPKKKNKTKNNKKIYSDKKKQKKHVRMPLKQSKIHSSGRGSKTWDKRYIGKILIYDFLGKSESLRKISKKQKI